MKSKRSRLQVYDKGILRIHPQICLDAADGHIDFRHFQVSGFDFCPKMETLSLRPLCVSMNFMDCTNIFPPPDPQQESQQVT